MAPEIQTTIIPHNQQPYVQRTYPTAPELDASIARAAEAQKTWHKVPLEERIAIGRRFMDEFKKMSDEIPLELTMQMGRPVSQGAGEIRGTLERASYMLDIAASSLADVSLADTDKPGFKRYIKRVPIGVVFVIAPWNFPYLTSINSILPALIAGNTVLLKPSPQTPLTAERLALALTRAGLPPDAMQVLHLSVDQTKAVVADKRVGFTSFTGSVKGGREVQKVAWEGGFSGVALELGGKDPAYVREDADIAYTAAEIADGAFFNSGQSCCAIERVYVHEKVYDEFVAQIVEITKKYTLGDPTQPNTNLGPVVSLASAERARKQVADAIAQGAKSLIPENFFPAAQPGTTYVAPQILVDVTHQMDIMMEESFAPLLPIMKVPSDAAALELMNDSPYGLTASVWTNAAGNEESARVFGWFVDELECGTVFLNRCDYLDPALAWTGVKDSGRGISLSKFGYDQLTRAKSVHMKIKTT
ncbi:NAD-aldehyde dehydrogenase [Pholiota conissans]|uniref:NAD-aldehyde dehydrogenase n=1 Tax=Pholiota conissans TaxID=109636 RepID=A0A9P5YPF7_9AGAR|nr:NAD-aldehyde dehydrogenase [Pholiota conissans]